MKNLSVILNKLRLRCHGLIFSHGFPKNGLPLQFSHDLSSSEASARWKFAESVINNKALPRSLTATNWGPLGPWFYPLIDLQLTTRWSSYLHNEVERSTMFNGKNEKNCKYPCSIVNHVNLPDGRGTSYFPNYWGQHKRGWHRFAQSVEGPHITIWCLLQEYLSASAKTRATLSTDIASMQGWTAHFLHLQLKEKHRKKHGSNICE